jgi:hypothetical protein
LRPTTRFAYWTGILDEDDRDDHGQGDERHHHDEDLVRVVPPLGQAGDDAGGDRGEDHQRDAVADPALGDQLAQPHQQGAAGGQADHDQEEARGGELADDVGARFVAEGAEEEDVADRLAEGESDGQVAGVLGDFLLPDFALFLQPLQRWHDDRQQLQDDRCRDVGHDPQREEAEPREAASREEVEEAENSGTAEVLRDFLHRLGVHPRGGDIGAEPVQRQHRRRECKLLANVGNAERVENSSEH